VCPEAKLLLLGWTVLSCSLGLGHCTRDPQQLLEQQGEEDSGAQQLKSQLSVLPQLHFKADSTPLPVGIVTEVVHVLVPCSAGRFFSDDGASHRGERAHELCCGVARGFKLELRT